jgi:hypothetical protein
MATKAWGIPFLSLLLLFLLFTAPTRAMFMLPEAVPVDRIVKNATDYLQAHPNEAEAHYSLARVYYLAFFLQTKEVPAFRDKEKGRITPAADFLLGSAIDLKQEHSPKILLDYAHSAKEEYEDAIKLDPKNGLYQLGLACLLENVRSWLAANQVPSVPSGLNALTVHDIRRLYAEALSLSWPEDKKQTEIPIEGLESLVSYESAAALIQLAKEKDFQNTEDQDQDHASEILKQFNKLPLGAITPLVFSFDPAEHLSSLLEPKASMDFDLRGYGFAEKWPWVKPSLGFLVWDPQHTGKITSARQLFGGYTFQIFWKNGYRALSMLDDNHDGVLTGAELHGISVWFDRNGNGVADPGEVIPVEPLHIRAISTDITGFDGNCPMNARGITLDDGRTLKTWDWMVEPHCR